MPEGSGTFSNVVSGSNCVDARPLLARGVCCPRPRNRYDIWVLVRSSDGCSSCTIVQRETSVMQEQTPDVEHAGKSSYGGGRACPRPAHSMCGGTLCPSLLVERLFQVW